MTERPAFGPSPTDSLMADSWPVSRDGEAIESPRRESPYLDLIIGLINCYHVITILVLYVSSFCVVFRKPHAREKTVNFYSINRHRNMYAKIVRIFLTKKLNFSHLKYVWEIVDLYLNLFMCLSTSEIAARKNVTYSQTFSGSEKVWEKVNYSHLGKAELFSLKKCSPPRREMGSIGHQHSVLTWPASTFITGTPRSSDGQGGMQAPSRHQEDSTFSQRK